MHWLQHFLGFENGAGNGPYYLFWSGAGGDLAYLSFLGAGVVLYRKHNCQVRRCWRVGRHEFTEPDTGVTRLLCWRHHPAVDRRQLSRERLHLYVGKRPGRG